MAFRSRAFSEASPPEFLASKGETTTARKWRKVRETRHFSAPVPQSEHELATIPASILASQLTLLDLPLFKAITRKELMACRWTCKLKQNVSPHIVAFIAHFNQVCYWIVREILNVNNVKTRADTLMHVINVAEELYELNNINGLKAVMSALSSQPIFRLSDTWALVGKKERNAYARLDNLLSEDDNKAALRCYMETIPRPCIPFLGMYLTDLLFLDNCNNRQRMETLIDDLVLMQLSTYDGLPPIDPVLDFIQSQRYLDEMQMFEEDQHYKMSLDLEPRETQPITTCSAAMARASLDIHSSPRLGSARYPRKTQPVADSVLLTKSLPVHGECYSPLSRSLSFQQRSAINTHRRSRSNCDHDARQDFLFSLSVIAPEVSSGPRHLIDGSLMNSMSSVGSESVAAFSSDSSSLTGDSCHEPVVGVVVNPAQSDDDSETLLQNDFADAGSNSDSSASPRDPSTWIYPLISGTVQVRKFSCRYVEVADSPANSVPNVCTTSLPRSTGWLRSWKTASARVCGNSLALFAAGGSIRRRKSCAAPVHVNPFCVIDLHCDVSIAVSKARVLVITQPGEKGILLKTHTEQERDQWLTVLTETIAQTMAVSEEEPAAPLIDFDDSS